ncbi:MAG: phosphoglucosamine mutase [Alphaproteobacteria bacterium]
MGNKLFGTDGVRGVANVYPMTAEFAFSLARACADLVCTKRKKAAIAKDTRVSGDMLEAAMIAGFTSQGVDVVKLGVLPTPALTMVTDSLGVDMAVMITASHNPFHDNGIKLIDSVGNKFSDTVTAEVEAAVQKGEFSLNPDKIGKVYKNDEALECYVAAAKSVAGEGHPLHGLRVVLDCANGAFSKIMPQVFKDLGAGVIALSTEPDGYNINKDCGSQHVENLIDTVKNTKAQLGIACDGDGDRIIVCDEQGNRLDGDQIIAFLGKYFKEAGELGANTVVATILSNPALDRFLKSIGVDCVRAAVGERHVIDKMKELGSNIGGEESGHMVIADYSKTGDAMIVALVISLGLLKSGKKMSEIFPLFQPMLKKRVDTKFKSKEEMLAAFELPEFKSAIADAEKKIEGKGKVLVRKSGTEPKIQVWVWGDEASFVDEVNKSMASVLLSAQGYDSQKDVL